MTRRGGFWRERVPADDLGADAHDTSPVRAGLRGRLDRAHAWLRDRPVVRRRIAVTCAAGAVALAALSAGGVWWSAPRPATVADLRADLAAGVVTSAARVSGFDRSTFSVRPPGSSARADPQGRLLAWSTSWGRVRYVAPDDDTTPADVDAVHTSDGPSPRTDELEAQLAAAGVPGDMALRAEVSAERTSAAVVALVLVGLLASAPRRGTRWFWVVFAWGSPWSLGVLAWIAVERPWRLDTGAVPAIGPGTGSTGPLAPADPRRWNGLAGYLLAVATSIALSLLVLAVQALLGPR